MDLAIDSYSAHGVELDVVKLELGCFKDILPHLISLADLFKFKSFCGLFSLRLTVDQAQLLYNEGDLTSFDELTISRDKGGQKFTVDETTAIMDSIHSKHEHLGLFVDINLEYVTGDKSIGFNRYSYNLESEVGPGYSFRHSESGVYLDNISTVIAWGMTLDSKYGMSLTGYQHDSSSIALSQAISPSLKKKDESEITDEGVDVDLHPISAAVNVVRTVVVDDCSFCQYNEKLATQGCPDDQEAVARHISNGVCVKKAAEANRTPPRSVKKVAKHKAKRMPFSYE
jgi:hypothetical protein